MSNIQEHEQATNSFIQEIWAKLMRCVTALAVPVCRLSWSISSHFVTIHHWSVHHSQKSHKNTKTPVLGVQGHSRSSMLIPLKCSSPVLVMISSMSVLICNCFLARRANIGKINVQVVLQGGPKIQTCLSVDNSAMVTVERHVIYQKF